MQNKVCQPIIIKKKKLKNVAIAMHCNLRPPDSAPVILRSETPMQRLK